MKKKIRKTGEVVDVIDYFCNESGRSKNDWVKYISTDGEYHIQPLCNLYFDFEDVKEEPKESGIDWEKVRCKVSCEIFVNFISNAYPCTSDVVEMAKDAIWYADVLVEELKKGGEYA